jgi:hypothetical protein
LKNRLEEDEDEPFRHGGKEPLLGSIVEDFFDEWHTRVLGQKGAMSEAKDVGDMVLNLDWGIKK